MNKESNFKTYLFISHNKISISVNEEKSFKQIYYTEAIIQNDKNFLEINFLDNFLSHNIFELEKKINEFIKSVYIIVDLKNLFSLKVSMKKNSFENIINKKILAHLLIEAKNQCKKSLINNEIIHILIDNYKIDGREFLQLPENLECKNFSIDIQFICLPTEFVKDLENVLKRYQIIINKIVCANYVKNFLKEKIVIYSNNLTR